MIKGRKKKERPLGKRHQNTEKVDPKDVMKRCCKSCVLHPDPEKRIKLGEGRLEDIMVDAIHGVNQICHHSQEGRNTICRGVRDYQIDIFYKIGLIPERTEESLLSTMERVLNDNK